MTVLHQNLRFRSKVVELPFMEDVENNPYSPPQPIMTWAPTHVEIALLGDVLRYANIIDGLSLLEKKKIRKKLEIQIKDENVNYVHEFEIDELTKHAPTLTILALEGERDWFFCCKLNVEYVNFLRDALQPYLDEKKNAV